jgi:hypothetical protein
MISSALLTIVQQDEILGRDPLTVWLRDHPEQIDRVLPVIVRSTGEWLRLMRQYPNAGAPLRRLAREVGLHKMGQYDGRS